MKKDKISYLAVDHKSAINDDGQIFYIDDDVYITTLDKRVFFKIKGFTLRNDEILAHFYESCGNAWSPNTYININKMYKYINGMET